MQLKKSSLGRKNYFSPEGKIALFNLNDSMRYYLYPYPTDMRKSFYTLSGVVKDLMGQDVRNGDVFIFIGRTCSSMKILHYVMWWSGDLPFTSGAGTV